MAKKSKAKRARRPTVVGIGRYKLNPTLRANICKFLAYGVSVECAAEQEGVTSQTFYAWLRRGRTAIADARAAWDAQHPDTDPDEADLLALIDPVRLEFVHLVTEVQRAYARAEGGYTRHIHQQAAKDWRAAAWWLERRRPMHYGSRAELLIEHEDRAPASMTNAEMVSELQSLGFVQATVVEAAPSANDNGHTPDLRRLGAADGGDDDARREQTG